MAIPESAARFLSKQVERVRNFRVKKRLVFPEGDDPRVVAAAAQLAREGLIEPIVIGPKIPDDASALKRYANIFFERRRARGITEMEAMQIAQKPLMYGALMVAAGDVDGFVGGVATEIGRASCR